MMLYAIGRTVLVGAVLVFSVSACGHTMMGRMKGDVLKAKAEMASEAKATIEQAIKAASEKVQGTVIEAELENRHGTIIWEVEVVTTDGTVMEVIVDSATGAVTSVEKKKSDTECCY